MFVHRCDRCCVYLKEIQPCRAKYRFIWAILMHKMMFPSESCNSISKGSLHSANAVRFPLSRKIVGPIPVTIFGSVIILLNMGIHEYFWQWTFWTWLFRLFKIACLFIAQFENVMGFFTLKTQIKFFPCVAPEPLRVPPVWEPMM